MIRNDVWVFKRNQSNGFIQGINALKLYKDQSGIEQNFGLLKDPVIVNGIILKKQTRIEVLGLALLIALLIRRLMERCMRHYLFDPEKTFNNQNLFD